MKQRIKHLFFINCKPVIMVEDGSVDVDKLEEDGFYVIVYRQGAKLPILLTVDGDNAKN